MLKPTRLGISIGCVTIALLFMHCWLGRNAMNPDGISYLDVGDSFARHDWAHAINGWWSPLYPCLLGSVLHILRVSPQQEFPATHFVNFLISLLALFAFQFFLSSLIRFLEVEIAASGESEGKPLESWALTLVGYAVFLWVVLEVVTLYDVSPDLLVVAVYCLSMGGVLRLGPESDVWKFMLWGCVIGIGYWAKAILFPVGILTLAVCLAWHRSSRAWRYRVGAAAIVFAVVVTPLISLLSMQKGRLTFGDVGKVAYAWYVSPTTFGRNWQGTPPESGTPKHATRQVLLHPPVFEFDGPLPGTYPPWTDPSYWNDGIKWTFNLKSQIKVLFQTVASELRLLLRSQPALVAGVILLAMMGGRLFWNSILQLWPVAVICLLSMAVYLPLLVNDRYLGGPLLVLFLALYAGARLGDNYRQVGSYIAIAVFALMMLGTADYTVRVATSHYAIPGVGPMPTTQQFILASRLREMGVLDGAKVAIIGDGTGAYWARLARVRIVSEIMYMHAGEFWQAPPEVQEQVYEAFRKLHVVVVVADCNGSGRIPEGWSPVDGTEFCVHALPY